MLPFLYSFLVAVWQIGRLAAATTVITLNWGWAE